MKTEVLTVAMVYNGTVASASNVTIDNTEVPNRLLFECFHDSVKFAPRVVEYSFVTKVLQITPEAGQLSSGDQIDVVISVIS
jgi:hypothetical protein